MSYTLPPHLSPFHSPRPRLCSPAPQRRGTRPSFSGVPLRPLDLAEERPSSKIVHAFSGPAAEVFTLSRSCRSGYRMLVQSVLGPKASRLGWADVVVRCIQVQQM
jgi:hypothetical protein